MRLTVTLPAPEGTVFASTAFESSIGQPMKALGERAVLVAAKVIDKGHAVEVEIEIPGIESLADLVWL